MNKHFLSLLRPKTNYFPELSDEESDYPARTFILPVCRRWSYIVHKHPILWKDIRINIGSPDVSPSTVVPIFLRSCDLPLTLKVNPYMKKRTELGKERQLMEVILSILTPYIHRCETLEIGPVYSDHLPTVASVLTHANPELLTSLSLKTWPIGGRKPCLSLTESYPFLSPLTSKSFTNLHVLRLDAYSFTKLQRLKPLSWFDNRRGTKLTIENYTNEMYTGFFRSFDLLTVPHLSFLAKFEEVCILNVWIYLPDPPDLEALTNAARADPHRFHVPKLSLQHFAHDQNEATAPLIRLLAIDELYINSVRISDVGLDFLPKKMTIQVEGLIGWEEEDLAFLRQMIGNEAYSQILLNWENHEQASVEFERLGVRAMESLESEKGVMYWKYTLSDFWDIRR
ncbi:hypothetical protein H0H93_012444 [Arthromyces matolae]|nr:hypothetical protein H0H93_012444 [Arthromyces matolae]